MAGRKPDYRVCTVEKTGENDAFYTDVGSGWSFASERSKGISVKLRPNIAIVGEIVLFEARD